MLLVLQFELKAEITLYVQHILCLLTKSPTEGCLECESSDQVLYVFLGKYVGFLTTNCFS